MNMKKETSSVVAVKKLAALLKRLRSSHGQTLGVLTKLSKLASRQSSQLKLLTRKAARISKSSRLNLATDPTALATDGQLRGSETSPRPSENVSRNNP